MSGEAGLIDLIIFIVVGVFIYTRFFGHKLPGGKPKNLFGAQPKKRRTRQAHLKPVPTQQEKPAQQAAAKVVPLKPTKQGLAGLKEVDSTFNEKEFVAGAKHAFGMYYTAWVEKDEETLADLLTPNLFDDVMDELETAAQEGKTPYLELDDKIEATLVDGRLNGRTAIVEVKYSAHMVQDYISQTAKTSRKKAKTVSQVWVWARPVGSEDPNWELQAINPIS